MKEFDFILGCKYDASLIKKISEKKVCIRIIHKDGRTFPYSEFRADRINVFLKDKIVFNYTIG